MSVPEASEFTIPLLPCTAYDETLTFYSALGFAITHQQQEPYLYLAVKRGRIDLHFTGSLNGSQAKNAVNSALVMVAEVHPYHQAFAAGMRANYGKVPTAGLPRLARLRPGQTRFQIFDPNGNSLIFINHDEPDVNYDEWDETLSPVEKTLNNAIFLRDTYANDQAAASLLDRALARHKSLTLLDRARLLAMRAELAVALGDEVRTAAVREELEQIILSPEEQERYRHELQAADQLAQWISSA